MTVCNLSIELGAKVGMVAPDQKTYEYLEGRRHAPKGALWDQALAHWQTLPTDPGATFDREEVLECSELAPQITWGTSLEDVVGVDGRVPGNKPEALAYMGLAEGRTMAGTKVDRVFIGLHQLAPVGPARGRLGAARAQGRQAREGLGGARLLARQAGCRGRGPARAVPGSSR